MSMGSVLLMGGDKGKRMALPNSRIMIHQGSAGFRGNTPDLEVQAKEVLHLRDNLVSIYHRHTDLPHEKLMRDMERDYFMSRRRSPEIRPDRHRDRADTADWRIAMTGRTGNSFWHHQRRPLLVLWAAASADRATDRGAGPRRLHLQRVHRAGARTGQAEQEGRAASSASTNCPAPREIKAYLDEFVIGQEEAKKALAVAVVSHYQRLAHPDVNLQKSNILLIGPTGTGKTLLAQSLAEMLEVPFAIADATTLTEAGYVGDDVENVIVRLFRPPSTMWLSAERGIIYIDEIDKIARKSEGTSDHPRRVG